MYAFFLDIDGTIFNGREVPQSVVESIARARDAGHKVFINTARAYIGMPKQVYSIGVDGFVNSFGQEICADGEFIHRRFIPKARLLEMAEYVFDNHLGAYFEGEIRIDINREREGGLNPKSIREFEEMLGDNKLCKIVLDTPPTDGQSASFSDLKFYDREGVAKGYSKALGIELVEKHYGIPHENTVAIGDTDPDIEMITYAGIGVAMGNGTPELKKRARYVTRHFRDGGVAFAIDRIIEGNLSELEKNE